MPSSTSASEPAVPAPAGAASWRRFLRTLVATLLVAGALVYGFVAVIDPWDMLPLSPPLPRVPISTNARFSFPALARQQRFDAALFGTSTGRLMRPATLDPLLGTRLANLAMNSASAWEQSRLLTLFLRRHPAPRLVMIDIDAAWCRPGMIFEREVRPLPRWMYRGSPWQGYRHIFNLYAVQEAANQLSVMLGWKPPRYGLDGYTNFLPPDQRYDPARVGATFRDWGAPSRAPATTAPLSFPTDALLAEDLAAIPAATPKLLFLPPITAEQQGADGTELARVWATCKRSVLNVAAGVPNVTVVDFMLANAVTLDRGNYWDPIHYRITVAERMMSSLGQVWAGDRQASDFYRVLRWR